MNQKKIKLISTLAIILSVPAYALPDDQSQPISVEADKATFDQKSGVATYKGNVIATQGSIRIVAESLIINTNTATSAFQSLHATGTPSEFSQVLDEAGTLLKATGNTLDYDTSAGELEIHKNGFLKRGDNEIAADYIHYFMETDVFNAENRGSGRVNMTLQPATEQ